VASLPRFREAWRIRHEPEKGGHVQVEGELRCREYEKDGVAQRIFECHVESILKLDRAARQELNGEELDS